MNLGSHGPHLQAAEEIEVAAEIVRDEDDNPADARRVTVRYRIEFSDAAEFSRDVLMTVE